MSDHGVSVIVVNYNCLSTLDACIGTILRSKYVEELLLVDNASTDGSIESIKHHSDDRLKIIRLSRNVGLTSARNLAATQASCNILAITDADIAVVVDSPLLVNKYKQQGNGVWQCVLAG